MKNLFVPREKLSKKAKRALDARQRTQWAFPPASRVIPNKKKEAQAKKPRPGRYDTGWGFFIFPPSGGLRRARMNGQKPEKLLVFLRGT